MLENSLIMSRHPYYIDQFNNWIKWRRTYDSGDLFIHHYLKQFSRRETDQDFKMRREISYCPAFARAAINDVKNSIYQRFVDITREGGSRTYQDAVEGRNGGIDKASNSMSSFLGRRVLPELLPMARVGIFVDMPSNIGETIADKGNAHPYIYLYRTEQILSWTYDLEQPDRLLSILLEDYNYLRDEKSGLTTGLVCNYRHLWLNEDGLVEMTYYDEKGIQAFDNIVLNLTEIPVVILEISESLLKETANYQIALLNLESSDLFYALRSNFPFYTEQFNPKSESLYTKQPGDSVEIVHTDRLTHREENTNQSITKRSFEGQSQEIVVGTSAGRRYPLGTERPGFINPSAEPLKISMEKAEQIKRDIRHLVNLSIQNLEPRRASADSKIADDRSLENGLSYIGEELQYAERKIAEFWKMYENTGTVATVNYPRNYSLVSEPERREEAKNLKELVPKIASRTFQKEAVKRIIYLTVGNYVSYNTLDKINKEIDSAEVIVSDPDIVETDIKSGLVSAAFASKLRGYPDGEVEVAAKEHAEKLARIAISQSQGIGAAAGQARGVPELGGDPQASIKEKTVAQDNSYDPVPKEKIRGEGK